MSKNYYPTAFNLKNKIREGWFDWNDVKNILGDGGGYESRDNSDIYLQCAINKDASFDINFLAEACGKIEDDNKRSQLIVVWASGQGRGFDFATQVGMKQARRVFGNFPDQQKKEAALFQILNNCGDANKRLEDFSALVKAGLVVDDKLEEKMRKIGVKEEKLLEDKPKDEIQKVQIAEVKLEPLKIVRLAAPPPEIPAANFGDLDPVIKRGLSKYSAPLPPIKTSAPILSASIPKSSQSEKSDGAEKMSNGVKGAPLDSIDRIKSLITGQDYAKEIILGYLRDPNLALASRMDVALHWMNKKEENNFTLDEFDAVFMAHPKNAVISAIQSEAAFQWVEREGNKFPVDYLRKRILPLQDRMAAHVLVKSIEKSEGEIDQGFIDQAMQGLEGSRSGRMIEKAWAKKNSQSNEGKSEGKVSEPSMALGACGVSVRGFSAMVGNGKSVGGYSKYS